MNPQHLFQIIYTMTEQDRQQVSQGSESAARDTLDWSLRLSAFTATVMGGLFDLAVALMDKFKHEQRPSNPPQTAIKRMTNSPHQRLSNQHRKQTRNYHPNTTRVAP